ncbi:MAG: hypothetical protein ABIH39_03850 [Candidatus Margulisiibacteriota bacterium]
MNTIKKVKTQGLASLLLPAMFFILLTVCAPAQMETNHTFLFDLSTLFMIDSADYDYVGNFGGAIGIGGQSALLFPISDSISFGPNLSFTYHGIQGDLYYFDLFRPSLGGMLKLNVNDNPVYTYINYNFGWVSTEQENESSEIIAPAGSFTANVGGWTLGARTDIKITDTVKISPYAALDFLTLQEFAYMRYNSSLHKYERRWININFNNLRFGVAVYLDWLFHK